MTPSVRGNCRRRGNCRVGGTAGVGGVGRARVGPAVGSPVGPDADMVGFPLEPDAVAHAKRFGHVARELEPSGPVEHGVLDGVPQGRPVAAVVPQGLGAGPAVPDRDDPPDLRGDLGVVGHDQDGHPQLGVGRLERGEHRLGGHAVQLPRWLVREEKAWLVRDRGGDRDPLLLAARHLVRAAPRAVPHAQRLKKLGRSRATSIPSAARQLHRQVHVLRRREVGQQVPRRLLPDEPHGVPSVGEPLPGGHGGEIMPVDPDRPGRRRVQPGQDVHQRRLAAAGHPDKGGQLTARNDQVKALQRLHLDALSLVDADQPVAGDERARAVVGVTAVRGLGVQFLKRGGRCRIAQLFLLMSVITVTPASSLRRRARI